ncbi:MAG: hypothetical protein K1X66_06245 [Verrucomicrobiae bacterium]|nr:hypothetical protein [Verrucomicrobiae bacterium]
MKRGIVSVGLVVVLSIKSFALTGSGKQVVSYQPGSGSTLTQTSAALGLPDPLVGVGTPFVSILSPFNPPYEDSQLLQIGPGGQMTIQLSHFAIVGPGREIGIFSNVGIFDAAYPQGKAGSPITLFGDDKVTVEVSEDGQTFFSLGEKNISMFHNFFTDLANPYSSESGARRADFGRPFLGKVSDFAGKDYEEIKQVLAGSAGGNWLDASAAPLTKIGYVRLSLPANAPNKFELDAITVNNQLLGASTDGSTSSQNSKRKKITILRPLRNEKVSGNFMAIGTVKSKTRMVGIEYRVNHGSWQEGVLVDKNWSALVEVLDGIVVIQLEVRAFGEQGERTPSKFRRFRVLE